MSDNESTIISEYNNDNKRAHESEEEEEEEFIGPMPTPIPAIKKKKVLEHEKIYLDNLPVTESYEKSYMHRDIITHIAVTKTEFIITASCDGHVKFWKKLETGVEFVKHFRAHLGNVAGLSVDVPGRLLSTVSNDHSLKVFDVVNFDMINMMKLDYAPLSCEWIHQPGDSIATLAVLEVKSCTIRVYDGHGDNTPVYTTSTLHNHPVLILRYNPVYDVCVSVDKAGIIEYWHGSKKDYAFPAKVVKFSSKMDTSLYEFVSSKTLPLTLTFSPDGNLLAAITNDRKIKVFRFLTGKLSRIFNESLKIYSDLQQKKQQLPNMEFAKRMAIERDLDKSDLINLQNVIFDESSNFILYPTMFGVKVINLLTNKVSRIIGKADNIRPQHLALFQGRAGRKEGSGSIEMEASENPTLEAAMPDPTLFTTAFKKNRFYMYSRRVCYDERDVFNEKPSKEDIIAATETTEVEKLYESAVFHTSMGDVHMKLFFKECPKAVENFCGHIKNNYYNGHVFHRVIKGFMVQTGDPTGTGTGGESIWGGEFEDEFVPSLRHDRPYTVSMANAGPNSNGSQFFITLIPTPWLDNKHTVFGRVVKGMEVVQNISKAKTNPKTDEPYDEITILNSVVK